MVTEGIIDISSSESDSSDLREIDESPESDSASSADTKTRPSPDQFNLSGLKRRSDLHDTSSSRPQKRSNIDETANAHENCCHKSASSSAFAGSDDPFTALAQESPAGPEERLAQAIQHLHQPKVEADLPDGLLSVSLLKHQKIALAWMLNKESSGVFLGGILADEQGLGKTVSMIALIQMQRLLAVSRLKASYKSRTEAFNLDDDDADTVKGICSRRPMAGTLIACPASLLSQWAGELHDKVTDKGRLTVLVYRGDNRTKNCAVLAKYDVVLTTYAIVSNEFPKQPLIEEDDGEHNDDDCGTLARVKWSRIVLDESQIIKNHRTQVARACCCLRAKRRWCLLPGTPIQNSIDELFSYFRFLRYDPYDKYSTFVFAFKALISKDSVKGYMKLRLILRSIMLRRTKGTLINGQPIINLPPKNIQLTRVEFSKEEREFYDKLEQDSKTQFKKFAAAGTIKQNYANIQSMLLRLRQACNHPLLVKGLGSDQPSSQMTNTLPSELVVNLLKTLDSSSAMCCLACKDPPENAVVTMCGHVFCYQCVSDYLTGDDNTCSAEDCKEQLGPNVYSRSTLRSCLFEDDIGPDTTFSDALDSDSTLLRSDYLSSKIKHALEILKSHCVSKGRDRDASPSCVLSPKIEARQYEKALVFSQWTSMLDLMEMSMKRCCINYRRLDGTMSIAAREKAIKEFNTDPEVDVMLMTLKSGSLGLKMVAACRVIILDLWWNPTTEDQAIDRAHGIGQTRPVTVSRLTVKDTVEDRILTLQEDKRKMVASALGEDLSGRSSTRLTLEDLSFLFGG